MSKVIYEVLICVTCVLPYCKAHLVEMINAVWQDTCQTYKNLVDDLAHYESPIAQWLKRPTGIWKVMGSTPGGGSENSFSEYFDLRTSLFRKRQC